MADEIKAPVVPDPTKVETPADEPLIDNPRAAVENAVITENETVPEPEVDTPVKPETTDEKKEETPPLSEVDRIKQAVQKRINQVVAKQKSAEEQLVEAQAEIARLKSTTPVADKKDDAPPSIDQVEAYILKMAEEGNKKEEIAATRYLIKLEKEAAIKEVEDRQKAIKTEGEARIQRENSALLELAKDYIVYDAEGKPDMKADLTLSNQKGKLFEIAMGLYQDPELHKLYYNDPDRAQGLRRAVADAYREIHQQGLVTPKVVGIETVKRTSRVALAEPDAVETEETPTQSPSNNLSDAEKVREDIKQRNRIRNSRLPSR
jgi:hypothetical protein